MRSFGKVIDLLIVIAAVEFIPQISSYSAYHLSHYFDGLDPDHAFAWNYLHHCAQFVLAVLAMKLYFKRSMPDWGFNLSQWRWSINVFWKFAIGWTVFWTIGIIGMTLSSGQPLSVITHPLTSRNIIGNLSFMLLMPGPSEEALFRGFAVVVLAQAWKGSLQFGKVAISSAGIIAALLFMYAHIGYSIYPFHIYSINPIQLAMAFALGIYYAFTFQKTGSLLCPILSHSASDFIGTGILYLFSTIVH